MLMMYAYFLDYSTNKEAEMPRFTTLLCTVSITLLAGGAIARDGDGPVSRWALIGDPGNPPTTDEDAVIPSQPVIGGVDYLYRMSILELTAREYIEFVEAYLPIYMKNNPDVPWIEDSFIGGGIYVANDGSIQSYFSNQERMVSIGWEYAARYLNWIHHGRLNDEWAFESGVFDTSTFEEQPDVEWDQQEVRSPGARYWFPSLEEWTKAAYWDPNKLGEGIGGYWKYPNSTNEALLPAVLPEDGGQRNAGLDFTIFPLSVGSYPDQKSPWGVLDLAGGESEWLEYRSGSGPFHSRSIGGSRATSVLYNNPYTNFTSDADHVTVFWGDYIGYLLGLRIATGVFHPADLNQDGRMNYFDISEFIRLFVTGDELADFRLDGQFDIDDVRVFLGLWSHSP